LLIVLLGSIPDLPINPTRSQQTRLERIFGAKEKNLPPEELNARKEEENLFSGLPQNPTITSLKSNPNNSPKDDTKTGSSLSAKKGRINR
jgi:hypothetical protein